MNDELVEQLWAHVEDGKWFNDQGAEIAYTEIFDKYFYSEFKTWIDSLPESPVKKALLTELYILDSFVSRHPVTAKQQKDKLTPEQLEARLLERSTPDAFTPTGNYPYQQAKQPIDQQSSTLADRMSYEFGSSVEFVEPRYFTHYWRNSTWKHEQNHHSGSSPQTFVRSWTRLCS